MNFLVKSELCAQELHSYQLERSRRKIRPYFTNFVDTDKGAYQLH